LKPQAAADLIRGLFVLCDKLVDVVLMDISYFQQAAGG